MNNTFVQLDTDQRKTMPILLSGANCFISGAAGTGKSVLIHEFIANNWRNTVSLAPTGIAALNINGSTIHSFLSLSNRMPAPGEQLDLPQCLQDRIGATETVIVDEIGMVRSELFSALEIFLRSLAPPHLRSTPFGGRQIVCVGDFLQLPPVIDGRRGEDRDAISRIYGGIQAFETAAWRDAGFTTSVLGQNHRTKDPAYLEALHTIRTGGAPPSPLTLQQALGRINDTCEIGPLLGNRMALCTTNNQANAINVAGDAELRTQQFRFRGEIGGDFPAESLPVETDLALRIGSRVMLVANQSNPHFGFDFVNGDMGTVMDIPGGGNAICVMLDEYRTVLVQPYTWCNRTCEVETDPDTGEERLLQKPVGSYKQFPVRIAHAASIHKSQSLTLPAAHVVLGDRGPFAPGQLYTALSRVGSAANLSLDRPLCPSDVLVDPAAVRFDASAGTGPALIPQPHACPLEYQF